MWQMHAVEKMAHRCFYNLLRVLNGLASPSPLSSPPLQFPFHPAPLHSIKAPLLLPSRSLPSHPAALLSSFLPLLLQLYSLPSSSPLPALSSPPLSFSSSILPFIPATLPYISLQQPYSSKLPFPTLLVPSPPF